MRSVYDAKVPPKRIKTPVKKAGAAPGASPDATPDPNCGKSESLLRELFVNNDFEGIEGLGSGEEPPIDEKCRSAGHADFLAVGHVFLHIGLELAGGIALFKLVQVQAQLGGMLGKVFVGKGLLGTEYLVVKFPEFALLVGAVGGFGSWRCAVVHGQGEVTEDDADLVTVGVLNLF